MSTNDHLNRIRELAMDGANIADGDDEDEDWERMREQFEAILYNVGKLEAARIPSECPATGTEEVNRHSDTPKMPQAIYLAARFSRKPELQTYMRALEAAGHTVTSRWLTDGAHEWTGVNDADIPPDALGQFAAEDLADVDAADAFILFADQPSSRGGMWCELGYAIARGKRIIVVGDSANVFCHLEWIEHIDTPDALLTLLGAGEVVV